MPLRDEEMRPRPVRHLAGLKGFLSGSDFVVANLESPISHEATSGSHQLAKYRFVTPYEVAEQVRDAGVTHVSVCNNHSIDQGFGGLMTTLDCVREAGLVPLGACRELSDPTYAVLERDGIRVAVGHKLSADQAQERYFTLAGQGYKRTPVPPLELSPDDRDSLIVKAIQEAGSVAFVGDSVTEGTKNGGYGWYEPLAAAFPEKRILKYAKGSMTSCWFRENSADIAKLGADLYVLAYGCNDIRYRDAARCAMTAVDYIANVDALVQEVRKANPGVCFALIAPWHSAPHDPICKCTREEKDRLYAEYTEALQRYCTQNGLLFIDPNPYICQKRAQRFWNTCMKDHIHPDAHNGIRLYSEGVVRTALPSSS